MYKKFFVLLLILSCLFGISAQAAQTIAPDVSIAINEHVVGESENINFRFHVNGYEDQFNNNNLFISQNFNIETSEGIGENGAFGYYDRAIANGTSYDITQDIVPGWQNPEVDCNTYYNEWPILVTPIPNGVHVSTPAPYVFFTCDFTNTKQNANAKTPVLIIPGVLGTDMFKGATQLWPNVSKMITDLNDQFMDPLQFQTNLHPLDGSVEIGNILVKPSFDFDYSEGLVNEFKNQGYTQGSGANDRLFMFPYDWRYGVSGKFDDGTTTVDLLAKKIQDIRDQTGSDKVDVIAHSTGGLLVKKYVMDHQSDNHIGKAVFIGVPNTGSPEAIKNLLVGSNFGIPFALSESEMQKLSQNMPVIYDLMPSAKYYTEKNSPLKMVIKSSLASYINELNYDETNGYLTSIKGVNNAAITNANDLHSTAFDDFDLRTAGVDLYAIDGCKAGTLSQITDNQKEDGTHISYDLGTVSPGDGTVPLESATNLPIDQDHKYYALESAHGKMISQDGIRPQIVNIISGSDLSIKSGGILPKDLITQDIALCQLNGKAISVFSPLNIDITDQDNNHSGLMADGVSIENNIPNASFEIFGEHKFVYLPEEEGQIYKIKLKGTGNGTFTIKSQDIENGEVKQTEVFSNLPVTTALTGHVDLDAAGSTTLSLKATGSGDEITIQPSSIVGVDQSQDLIAPVTTTNIDGALGQPGFYRSNVSINLSATDPTVNEQTDQTSGVLKTTYNLDNQGSQIYDPATPINVTAEGVHTLVFSSTDKAGNNEDQQTINFTVDKTAPEATVQFNPTLKDIQFTGTDNISSPANVTVLDQDDTVTLTDQAGNVTQIKLNAKNRKKTMAATIKSLTYNGQAQDISKNVLAFFWQFDKNNNLTLLSQNVASKKNYNILAVYNGKKTTLVGIDKNGLILKSLNSLTLLKVTTNKGDLSWGY